MDTGSRTSVQKSVIWTEAPRGRIGVNLIFSDKWLLPKILRGTRGNNETGKLSTNWITSGLMGIWSCWWLLRAVMLARQFSFSWKYRNSCLSSRSHSHQLPRTERPHNPAATRASLGPNLVPSTPSDAPISASRFPGSLDLFMTHFLFQRLLQTLISGFRVAVDFPRCHCIYQRGLWFVLAGAAMGRTKRVLESERFSDSEELPHDLNENNCFHSLNTRTDGVSEPSIWHFPLAYHTVVALTQMSNHPGASWNIFWAWKLHTISKSHMKRKQTIMLLTRVCNFLKDDLVVCPKSFETCLSVVIEQCHF